MSSYDPTRRGYHKVASSFSSSASSFQSSVVRIPTDLLLALLLNKTLLVSSALLARHWLLTPHWESTHSSPSDQLDSSSRSLLTNLTPASLSSWSVATVVFLFAATIQAVWFRVWTWLSAIRRIDPQFKHLPKRIAVLSIVLWFHVLIWLMSLRHLGAAK